MRSPGKGTRELARTTVGVGAPVPRALLILALRLVAVRRLPAPRRGLTEVVPDAPAKEGAPAQGTPACPPAVTAGLAQCTLQSPHRVPAPERPGCGSDGKEGGAGELRARRVRRRCVRERRVGRGAEGRGVGLEPEEGPAPLAGSLGQVHPGSPGREGRAKLGILESCAGVGGGVVAGGGRDGQGPGPIIGEAKSWGAGKGEDTQ